MVLLTLPPYTRPLLALALGLGKEAAVTPQPRILWW